MEIYSIKNELFSGCFCFCHHFIIQFLGFMRERIVINHKRRNDIKKRVYSSFGNQEFIEHYHFFMFEDAIAALKRTSLITHDIA